MKKSTETLSERLDKAREENDDLRFQVRIILSCRLDDRSVSFFFCFLFFSSTFKKPRSFVITLIVNYFLRFTFSWRKGTSSWRVRVHGFAYSNDYSNVHRRKRNPRPTANSRDANNKAVWSPVVVQSLLAIITRLSRLNRRHVGDLVVYHCPVQRANRRHRDRRVTVETTAGSLSDH